MNTNAVDSSDLSDSNDSKNKRRKKKKKKQQTPEQNQQIVISKKAQEQAEAELKSNKKAWTSNRDLLNTDIQKFINKSKASFAVDDIKHAMDNARIISRADEEEPELG